jgi:hypothetical protein
MSTKKYALSRRVISLILSLFVLAVLPLVSLYYSFEGASMRKHAMAELVPKGNLPESLTTSLKQATVFNLFSSNCKDTAILKPIIEQFKDEKVRFIFVGDSSYIASLTALKFNSYKQSGLFQTIQRQDNTLGLKQEGCQIVLTNALFEILHTYDLNLPAERTKIIEHLALLMTKK